MKHKASITACLLALSFFYACQQAEEHPPRGMQVTDFTGKRLSLVCACSRVLIVNLWTTWCGPCKAEIRHLVELSGELGTQGFDVVGIVLDPGTPRDILSIVRDMNISYPVYMSDVGFVSQKMGVEAVPTTLFMDCRGTIIKKLIGYHTKDELLLAAREIIKLRAEAPAAHEKNP